MDAKKVKFGRGDWLCSDVKCGTINFAKRNRCFQCGKAKVEAAQKSRKKLGQEIGRSFAVRSRGLFSAEDWQCVKCANVNWARRSQCNMCNTPKFTDVEERTGNAGGYDDRGRVEYIKREDDDEGDYDEFGRRRKRKVGKDADDIGLGKRNEEEYSGSGSELEDNEDLSKYDLSDCKFVD